MMVKIPKPIRVGIVITLYILGIVCGRASLATPTPAPTDTPTATSTPTATNVPTMTPTPVINLYNIYNLPTFEGISQDVSKIYGADFYLMPVYYVTADTEIYFLHESPIDSGQWSILEYEAILGDGFVLWALKRVIPVTESEQEFGREMREVRTY